MELSIIKLQDSTTGRLVGERRRRIRHKLHSPVYASFKGPSAGMVLELNELLDLSEDGFSVQTSGRLEVNRPITFSLDLPETKAYIHGEGKVVWGDSAGRGGIQFSGLTEPSQRVLKEWLLVNLFVAGMKNASRSAPASAPVERKLPVPTPILQPAVAARISDLSEMLSALDLVRSEVRAAKDFDAALHLITERALSLTGASGAALAFLTDDKMVCRASDGEPALPLGTAVDAKQGLTGECVRSGRIVVCEDTETDARVDREICRLLGIGSILATPIVADFRVVGLIEVFSPRARAFADIHETALDRLAEIVPKAQPRVVPALKSAVQVAGPVVVESAPTINTIREAVWEQEREAQEPLRGVPVRRSHIYLSVLTLAALFLAAGYLSAPKLAPMIERLWPSKPAAASSQATAAVNVAPTAANHITRAMTFDELRKLAEQGDADAQWEIGSRYRNGDGVPQNDAQAVKWFQRAAEQGHVSSQRALGGSYWSGRGVPQDLSKAYFWSVLAANQGDEISASQVQGIAIQMTKAQIAAAQSQADDWLSQRRAAKSATK